MDTLYDETHDPKYRASLLLRKMVRAGKLGRKTRHRLLRLLQKVNRADAVPYASNDGREPLTPARPF